METDTKQLLNRKLVAKEIKKPIKVLQFGEGNFLRAFVDYAFYRLNKELDFNAGVAIVQPLEGGMVDMIEKQDGLYTLFLNGIKNGEPAQDIYLIDNIVKTVNPYKDFQDYLDIAKVDTLEFVISNTTEAGIEFIETDSFDMQPPKSYPAKLAVFLLERYKYFKGDNSKGLTIIPCELINYNADTLKKVLLQYADFWNLETGFVNWLNEACSFHNTLVDRIVPGYPRNEIEQYNSKIDYQDNILVTAEPFFLWVIEGDEKLKAKLPFGKIDLDVKIVKDMQPYRTRKVRILNGAHTAMVPMSIMFGNETVRETLENNFTKDFVTNVIFDEINPVLELNEEEKKHFADAVLDRFRNPFIRHLLSDIALNSISKFKVRVLPTMLEYVKENHKLPQNITFSLACLIRFYGKEWNGKQLPVKDSQDVTDFFADVWKSNDTDVVVNKVLSHVEFWGEDLTKIEGLNSAVTKAIIAVDSKGIEEGYKIFVNQ